jgi:NAD+ synthase
VTLAATPAPSVRYMETSTTSCDTLLRIDAEKETHRLVNDIRELVFHQFKRKGAVLGVSGGIDSSVVAALCARALGPDHVLALLMPEADSSSDSVLLGRRLASSLGIRSELVDITSILEASGCYERRDQAIRMVFPEYGAGCKCKITLPDLLAKDQLAVFSIVVQLPSGDTRKIRLNLDAYLGVVAASNLKQRSRKMVEYYHADRLNYAVAGTPNRLEYELGFFVKSGDGAADFKPIAHLYKTQVYQLAEYLDIPKEIQQRPPTTDTYPLEQSQEEFYFSMPLHKMDICLYARDHAMPPAQTSPLVGLSMEQVQRAYSMIDRKRANARYLHMPPAIFAEENSR